MEGKDIDRGFVDFTLLIQSLKVISRQRVQLKTILKCFILKYKIILLFQR